MTKTRQLKRRNKAIFVAGVLALAAGAVPLATHVGQAQMSMGSPTTAKISLPAVDYRKDWVALGSWAVAAEPGKSGSQGIHVVYTQPESVAAYRKNGKFPDGAILVKELFTTTTESMTTGTVSRANKTAGWFVMVKDSTNRHSANKLWGDGWGWAYFDAKDRNKTTSTDYTVDCKGCHVPVRNSDWVYVQGYPVLRGK